MVFTGKRRFMIGMVVKGLNVDIGMIFQPVVDSIHQNLFSF